jgi:hypothetical protein
MTPHRSTPTSMNSQHRPVGWRRQDWRPLMGEPPSAELLSWVVLVLLTFAPAIGWWLAGGLRRLFT